jgi:hypothetical protein
MKNKTAWFVFVGLVMSLALVSCTHKPYHPTKTDREWAIDHEACEVWVREGIRSEPDTYDDLDEMKMIKNCMKQKGWQWERTGLFNFKTKTEE